METEDPAGSARGIETLALRRMHVLLKCLCNLVLIRFPGPQFTGFASVVLVRFGY